MSADIERNLKLIEIGYRAGKKGVDLDVLKQSILQLHETRALH